MNLFAGIDWSRTLLPSTSILETVIRGSITYLALFFLLRTLLKRQAGAVGITDLLLVVLIADAAQNAMADDYTSIPDGLLLVATMLFWSYALDWLGYRYPRMQRWVHPPALMLIKDGRMLRHNMRRELITEDELMSQLRRQGIADIMDVQTAYMEGDGRISVVSHTGRPDAAPERPTT